MPLARIDIPARKPATYGRHVADVVYEAIIATLNAPKDDRFQIIAEHTTGLIIDPTISESNEAPKLSSFSCFSTRVGRLK